MEHPAVAFQCLLRKASVNARLAYRSDLPFSEPVTLQLSHRNLLRESLFDYAFKHGGRTTFLTIKSVHTHRFVEEHLPDILSSKTKLTVLTVDPSGGSGIFDAIGQHLGIGREEVAKDVRDAWGKWKELEEVAPNNLEVCCYSSLPVWQGYIVHDKYAVIELLPCASRPFERPAIIALSGINGSLFEAFDDSVLRMPRSVEPTSRQTQEREDDGVSRHAIYTQFFTEYRRYRDYELQTCTWFSAAMGFFVLLLAKNEVLALLHENMWARSIFLVLMLLLGGGACRMLFYAKRRLSETGTLLQENFPESFRSFGNPSRGVRKGITPFQVLLTAVVVTTLVAVFGMYYLAQSYSPPQARLPPPGSRARITLPSNPDAPI